MLFLLLLLIGSTFIIWPLMIYTYLHLVIIVIIMLPYTTTVCTDSKYFTLLTGWRPSLCDRSDSTAVPYPYLPGMYSIRVSSICAIISA